VLDQFVGPRNPFGYLAFLVVTVNGEVIVHYQRNRNIFSSFSTSLLCAGQLTKATHRKETAPYTIFKQESKSTLDFSMVAGRAWNSISHASLLLNDGKFVKSMMFIVIPRLTIIFGVRWQSIPCNSQRI
jgi:hypothetical protein